MKTKPKILAGLVVSDRMAKTVVVRVDRLVRHRTYGKYLRRSKRYLVHDEVGHKVGDRVKIQETRPISRRKHFEII
ncbi:MAG: 30S ribosomal protein S17 [Candidatus Vogelbacteria bacterium]|nr:30S ribosomal protein S17 [Candidatus Vogelbacteria bacterium]